MSQQAQLLSGSEMGDLRPRRGLLQKVSDRFPRLRVLKTKGRRDQRAAPSDAPHVTNSQSHSTTSQAPSQRIHLAQPSSVLSPATSSDQTPRHSAGTSEQNDVIEDSSAITRQSRENNRDEIQAKSETVTDRASLEVSASATQISSPIHDLPREPRGEVEQHGEEQGGSDLAQKEHAADIADAEAVILSDGSDVLAPSAEIPQPQEIDASPDQVHPRHSSLPALSPQTTITMSNGRKLEEEDLFHGSKEPHPIHGNIPRIRRVSTYNDADALQAPSLQPHDDEIDSGELLLMSFRQEPPPPKTRHLLKEILHKDDDTDTIFPTTIKCILTITFNEDSNLRWDETIKNFKWYTKESYESIQEIINKLKRRLQEQRKTTLRDEFYLRYASCVVKGSRDNSGPGPDGGVWIDEEEILPDVAIQTICGFIHDFPFQPFDLRVHCDYSSLDIWFMPESESNLPPPKGSAFPRAIRDQYHSKMNKGRRTRKGSSYLSLADQRVLIHNRNVDRIVDQDHLFHTSELHLTEEQKKDLKYEVKTRPASILQAVCTFNLIPMKFLYHILFDEPHKAQTHSDNLRSLRLKERNGCEHELCQEYHYRLVENIPLFFAATIRSDAEHLTIEEGVIIPLRDTSGVKNPIGQGASGIVYEIDIDPHHQQISSDFTKTYALKVLDKKKEHFDREIKMLLHLATYLPHEHILTHITSWEQGQEYCILYEKAHCNLRHHMTEYRGGDLSTRRMVWFLCQLRGLSDAVRRIHFFHEPKVDPRTGVIHTTKTGVVGFHHDIKPENILAFDLPKEMPILKLSDFGSGKFSNVETRDRSGIATRNRATQTYSGPECRKQYQTETGKQMTRPFDMWALGCVFLEMLLWFLDVNEPDGKQSFADMRVDPEYNPSPDEFDYFWQCNKGRYEINGAVESVLDKLETSLCKDMPLFQDLITVLRKLLVVHPGERTIALKLFNELDLIVVKAKKDLKDASPTYQDILERNKNPEKAADFTTINPAHPKATLLPLDRLGDDVSTMGESRVPSELDLTKSSDASLLRQDANDETTASLSDVGQQFGRTGETVHHSTNPVNDDEDVLVMAGPSQPRTELQKTLGVFIQPLEEEDKARQ